jgi:hypothetical protein
VYADPLSPFSLVALNPSLLIHVDAEFMRSLVRSPLAFLLTARRFPHS